MQPEAESMSQHTMTQLQEAFSSLPDKDKSTFLGRLFKSMIGDVAEADFIELSLKAMKRLHESCHSNILYKLAYSLATMRNDNTDSLLPIHRMPFGLIEYVISFFYADSVEVVGYQAYCDESFKHIEVNLLII